MYQESKILFFANFVATLFFATLTGAMFYIGVMANKEFNGKYLSAWELADRSSTIQAKSEHINKFVNVLENNRDEFADNAALIYTTPQNSFDANFAAIKTLRDRLETIKAMPETEFAYQTAIQQITAQEQGEAQGIINTIEQCWWRENHYLFWLAGPLIFIALGALTFVSICIMFQALSEGW